MPWKELLTAFLDWITGRRAAAKAADNAVQAQERIADAEASGPRTSDDVDKRLHDGTF